MPTSNETIRDDLIRHQVGLLRFSAGLRNRILRLLNRAEPELRAAIRARLERAIASGVDPGPVVTKRMARQLAAVEVLIRERQAETFREIRALVRSELGELSTHEASLLASIIERALPVELVLTLPSPDLLRSIVTARPFQGRLLRDWLSDFEAGDRRRMMQEIRTGMLFGETPTQIGRRIFGTRSLAGTDGVREITRRGAQVLAQTAVASITNAAKQAIYERNAAVIAEELYVATLDSKTTPQCRALDGERFEVGRGPRPPLHGNCRSVRVPVIDGRALGDRPANAATAARLEGLRGAERRRAVRRLVGQVPASTTYQQWLSRQPASFQDTVLGPTRGRLFRKGGLTLDRFVDNSGEQYTLAQLRELEPEAFERAGI